MKVRAKSLGIYKHTRRRAGDVFEVDDWEREKGRWMEPIEDEAPAKEEPRPAKRKQTRSDSEDVI